MRSRRLVAAAVAATALAAPASASAAEQFAAVTNSAKVITFGSDGPGNLDSVYPIQGLAANDKIVGIDERPATGQLYALGRTGQLYVLDASSGRTRAVAKLTAPLAGNVTGFNFNPTVDRIRVTTDTQQNLRVNPVNGVTAVDGPLQATGITGVAYSNPVPGATSTQLFDLDATRNLLLLQNPPNTGALTPVGTGLGVDVAGPSGFDVNAANFGYASFKAGGAGPVNLYQINLATGKATPAAAQPAIGTRAAVDDTIAIAALGTVPDDRKPPALTADAPTGWSRADLSRGKVLGANVGLNEAGRIQLDMRIGRTLVAQGKAEVYTYAGGVRLNFQPTAEGRRLFASNRYKLAKMRFSARDRAGNLTTQGERPFALR